MTGASRVAGAAASARGSRRSALVLGATFFLTALLALHAHRAAAPLVTAAGLAVPLLAWLGGRAIRPDPAFTILFGAWTAWAGLGLLWSIAPAAGLEQLPRVAYLMAAGILMTAVAARLEPADARLAARALLAGVAAGALLLLIEAATAGAIKDLLSDKANPVMALKAGSTILVLLLWPALAFLIDGGRGRAAGVLAVAVILPLALLDGRSAFLAALAGTAVFALAWRAPRLAACGLALVAIAGVLTAPVLVLYGIYPGLGGFGGGELLPFSGQHRMEIWHFAAEHVLERPFQGWGLNVSRVFPGGDRILDPASGAMQMPLHPHNAALQWWLELGLPGAVAGMAAILLLARAARRLPTAATRAAGLALLTAGLVVSMLSYGAWQNWWLAAIGLAAAGMATAARARPGKHP
ncbi:hypothetical protein STVA_03070 [Allostella vacuolata]|nr:hypothetical protein STVA_03070 [Stella vacuolata]